MLDEKKYDKAAAVRQGAARPRGHLPPLPVVVPIRDPTAPTGVRPVHLTTLAQMQEIAGPEKYKKLRLFNEALVAKAETNRFLRTAVDALQVRCCTGIRAGIQLSLQRSDHVCPK